ncbi:MAG: SUMF1/EgtB/PvdO family nonheme iron enzyme [Kiritimatiellae bacterium]|nr:SUMF1/EgtB/PvdO family nonheme iron enzyme [Kiritimatiellia bacterium]
MRSGKFIGVCVVLLCGCAAMPAFGAQGAALPPGRSLPAFPGAEGFGADTPGGRGGRVLEVTNLNADGPGSLAVAVGAEGARIVVFRVGGTIHLQSDLRIREPFVTLAGQTAPGDGVCLRGGSLIITTHDVVVRYLRVRVGDHPDGSNPENRDVLGIAGEPDNVYNIVIDHCSFSWGTDENVQTWYGPRNVTIQWSISSESLHDSLHPKGPHGKGMLIGSRANTVTVHHCLLAHNDDRNPRIGNSSAEEPSIVDFRNNVVYNHGPWLLGQVCGRVHMNIVGNSVKQGPDCPTTTRGLSLRDDDAQRFFFADNLRMNPSGAASPDETGLLHAGSEQLGRLRAETPIPAPPVATEPAADAFDSVLNFAGATLPVRDVVDARIVQEVRTAKGWIMNAPAEVGGWPNYRSAPPAPDADHDGMPDAWEDIYGLDANNPADAQKDQDGDGYTNVEEFLNATDPLNKTAGRSARREWPREQEGNARLGFERARNNPLPPVPPPAPREPLLEAVRASGKEVADLLGIRFVEIAPGEFMKGRPSSRLGQVKVILTKPYEIAASEINQAQWTRVMGNAPWSGRDYAADDPDYAVTYVSRLDCREFIARLNACGSRLYRLPTEAEWEYACRAGADSESGFGFGKDEIGEYAWHFDNTVRQAEKHAHPVGLKKPNAWGLFDMAGNVFEWCHDGWDLRTWSAEKHGPVRKDPVGPESARYYVVRGGSFYDRPNQILTYPARCHRIGYRNFDVGFRIVRVAP